MGGALVVNCPVDWINTCADLRWLLGTHVGDPRPPLLPLDEAHLDEMRSLLID